MPRKSPRPHLRKTPDALGRPYVRFTRWRRRRFFALLAESGNVRMAAELSGAGLGCIYRLRRVEAGFSERMAAAREVANKRLERSKNAPPPRFARVGARSCPPDTILACRGQAKAHAPSPGKPGEDLEPGLVIRRGIGGRLRVMAAGPHWWEARHDAIFLGHLAATGNVAYAARATGFTPKVAHDRRKVRPDFAAGWERALVVAQAALAQAIEADAQAALAAAAGIADDKDWMAEPHEIDAAINALQCRIRAPRRLAPRRR